VLLEVSLYVSTQIQKKNHAKGMRPGSRRDARAGAQNHKKLFGDFSLRKNIIFARSLRSQKAFYGFAYCRCASTNSPSLFKLVLRCGTSFIAR